MMLIEMRTVRKQTKHVIGDRITFKGAYMMEIMSTFFTKTKSFTVLQKPFLLAITFNYMYTRKTYFSDM